MFTLYSWTLPAIPVTAPYPHRHDVTDEASLKLGHMS